MAAHDNIVFVNTSSARNITLPTPTNGRTLTIKDSTGSAGTNNITVLPSASELIDGASSKLINVAYGEMQLCSNGTDWFTNQPFVGASVTFPLLGSAGSAAAPTYSFSADSDTGMYNWTSGGTAFSANGTDVLLISANGTLNVLNQAPVRLFDTSGGGASTFVGLRAPTTLSGSYTITWPTAAPGTDTFLKFDGSNYVWTSATPTFPLLASAGSVSAPSYSFSGDTSTGIWSVAAGNINMTITGTDRIRLGPGSIWNFYDHMVVRYWDVGTAGFVAIQGPSTASSNYTITLPSSAPASNTFLEYDGTNYIWSASPIALAAFGSTPNANGLSVSGQTLNMEPADASNPGGVSTTTQTFAGAKTFSSPVTANSFIPTSNTVPANGLYRQAANNIAFATNTTYVGDVTSTGAWNLGASANGQFTFTGDGTSPNFIYNSGSNFTPIAQPTFMFSGTNSQSIRIAGGNTSTAGGTLRLYGGTHATLPNVTELYNNGGLTLTLSAANNVVVESGDLKVNTAGKGLFIKEGSNAKMGTATLVAGTVTVSTTAVTSSSRIFLTVQSLGTVAVATPIAVTARTAGTSFTITSSAATDTSVVAWILFEPA